MATLSLDNWEGCGGLVSVLKPIALLQGDSGGPVMCREPAGHWVQVGIISFASKCAQEDTPVLLTDLAAHSPWLQAQAQGAVFPAQSPGTPETSDEDSCVGTSRGCWLQAVSARDPEANFSSGQRTDMKYPFPAKDN